jgi:hypothetical protein
LFSCSELGQVESRLITGDKKWLLLID